LLTLNQKNLIKRTYAHYESYGAILSDKIDAIEVGLTTLQDNRKILEKYLMVNPYFEYSFEPVEVKNAPEIIVLMADASKKANVGPMASVAGALADLMAKAMINSGAKIALVENGGEASLFSNQPVDVALQIGETELSNKIGFRIEHFPAGIATSSGVYSHAFSFGDADAVTIFAQNACLADAAATATCNVVKGKEYEKTINEGVERALNIDGVQGVFISYGNFTGVGGRIPSLLKID
jgi:ApbE superfamily uncharacterized protein (UPF0280 family)